MHSVNVSKPLPHHHGGYTGPRVTEVTPTHQSGLTNYGGGGGSSSKSQSVVLVGNKLSGQFWVIR